MAGLIAKRDILFDGKNYKPGEQLPTYNDKMNKLWVEAGSAVWDKSGEVKSDETKTTAKTKKKE